MSDDLIELAMTVYRGDYDETTCNLIDGLAHECWERQRRIDTLSRMIQEDQDELARLRAEVDRLTAALADERAHADALAEAVEMFATDRNWLQGGPFDPCSPSFTGTSMASAVAKQHRDRRSP